MKLYFGIKIIDQERMEKTGTPYLVFCIEKHNLNYNCIAMHDDDLGRLNTPRGWHKIQIKRIG
jgi:hypothetical protein